MRRFTVEKTSLSATVNKGLMNIGTDFGKFNPMLSLKSKEWDALLKITAKMQDGSDVNQVVNVFMKWCCQLVLIESNRFKKDGHSVKIKKLSVNCSLLEQASQSFCGGDLIDLESTFGRLYQNNIH